MTPVSLTREGSVLIAEMRGEPDVMLDSALVQALTQVLDEAEDSAVGAIVLKSLGRSFCAGASFSRIAAWSASRTGAEIEADGNSWNALFSRFETCPIPIVAQVEGAALGAGLGLALACDFRIATAKAVFGAPEARFGILPAGGTVERLVRICGLSTTRRLLLSAEIVKGEAAGVAGLVDRLVAPEAMGKTALELAKKLSGLSTPALAAAKRLIFAAATGSYTRQAENSELFALADLEPTRRALRSLLPKEQAGQREESGGIE